MAIYVEINPREREATLRSAHSLCAGESAEIVLSGIPDADTATLSLRLYRDRSEAEFVAAARRPGDADPPQEGFVAVQGRAAARRAVLDLRSESVASWASDVFGQSGSESDGPEEAPRPPETAWMVVADVSRVWAACEVPFLLRPMSPGSADVALTLPALVERAREAAEAAEAWATGGTGGTPTATNNARYYAERAEETLEDKADKATTLAGYGITDAYTKTETDGKIASAVSAEATARNGAIADAISAVKNSAPEAFDTLKEIADWIGDGTSGAQAVINQVANKVDKVSGKGLSTNDYTTAEKQKLAGIAAGAQVNVIETVKVNGTALTPSGKTVNIQLTQTVPSTTETLAEEEYDYVDNSVMVDTPRHRGVKLKIRNLLSNTVNTLDTSASGTIATREWVQQNVDIPSPSDADPAANGTAWEGESDNYSRADHVHPTDTTRQASIAASGILKGDGSGGVTAAVAGTDYQAPLSAAQLADIAAVPGKADAADLRYRIAEAQVSGWRVPDEWFPIKAVFAYGDELTFAWDTPSSDAQTQIEGGSEYSASPLYLAGNNIKTVIREGDDPGTEISLCSFDAEPGGTGAFIQVDLGRFFLHSTDEISSTDALAPTSYALADRTVNLITASDETSIDIELPAAVTVDGVRYCRDFILDVDNSTSASDLALEFTGLDVDYAFVPLEDDSISEMMTIGAGERVRLYFTETPYMATGSLPVINVARVTLGDFVTSTTPATQGGN